MASPSGSMAICLHKKHPFNIALGCGIKPVKERNTSSRAIYKTWSGKKLGGVCA